jgi:hypothetical protein
MKKWKIKQSHLGFVQVGVSYFVEILPPEVRCIKVVIAAYLQMHIIITAPTPIY